MGYVIGDRFFNQGVDTGFEELFCDLMVGGGGGGDANGFDFPDQVTEILKVGSSEFLGFISLGGVRVADANKLGFRKVPINAGVLFTEVSDAYDCNLDAFVHSNSFERTGLINKKISRRPSLNHDLETCQRICYSVGSQRAARNVLRTTFDEKNSFCVDRCALCVALLFKEFHGHL